MGRELGVTMATEKGEWMRIGNVGNVMIGGRTTTIVTQEMIEVEHHTEIGCFVITVSEMDIWKVLAS